MAEKITHRQFEASKLNEFLQTLLEARIEENFRLVCKEMKEVGYTELWIGDAPPGFNWPSQWNQMNNFFGVPFERRDSPPLRDSRLHSVNRDGRGWPAIWYIVAKYFENSCGNGHCQSIRFNISETYRGRHKL